MEFIDIYFQLPMLIWIGLGVSFLVSYLFFRAEKKYSLPTVAQEDILGIYGVSTLGKYLRYLSIFFICFLLFIITAKPYKNGSDIEIKKDGIDIVVAMDISGSMDFADFEPSRLELAKSTLRDFVGELSSDRLGLVVFAGKPISSQPLTFDYSIINETIDSLSTGILDQNIAGLSGTNIGDALLLSKGLFDTPGREKIIILVTDGDANSGANPSLVAQVLAEENITVYSIGIGKDTPSEIIVQNGFFGQKQTIPALNSTILEDIADKTDGVFFRADNADTLRQIFTKLEEIQTNELTTRVQTYKIDYYTPFIYALGILMFLFIISELIYPKCK